MSTHLTIIDKVFLIGLHGRLGLEIARRLEFLLISQAWDSRKLAQWQASKLRSLLRQASSNTKYYSNEFIRKAIALADEPRTSIASLPVLPKSTVRDRASDLWTSNVRRIYSSRTGGTTGTPVELRKCASGVSEALAAMYRGRAYAGIKPSDFGIMLYGFSKPSWKGTLRMKMVRKELVQAFGADDYRKQRFAKLVESDSAKFVEGFVSDLVDHVEAVQSAPNNLKAVFTTGEMLYPHQRQFLMERLNSRVFSYYGSNEIGGIAFECEHGNLHVTDEHVLVEVLDEQGHPVWEQPGRVVVTDLDNTAMPLLRYEIGDQAIISRQACPCGRQHTRITQLLGRQQDFLENEHGQKLSATFFEGRFRNLTCIGKVQLVQHDLKHVEVLYDGTATMASNEAEMLAREIQVGLGESVKVCSKRTRDFFVTERGKIPLIRRHPA